MLTTSGPSVPVALGVRDAVVEPEQVGLVGVAVRDDRRRRCRAPRRARRGGRRGRRRRAARSGSGGRRPRRAVRQLILSAELKTFFGRMSTAMRSASSWNARPVSLSGSTAAIGLPVVAAVAQRRHERQLGEQRHVELGGQLGAAAGAEDLVALAVVAGEPRHVLDDAAHRQVDLRRHRRREAGDLLGGRLRRRDDVDLAARQVLAERDGDVAGAGRHVDEQEVGLVPVDVGEELLERLVQHRAAPDDGLALGHEVADRDAAHAPRLGRQQHLVDDDRLAVGAEHAGDREAVDVGVDDADRVALGGERDGEVDGDAGLADAALAGRDEQRAGPRAGLGERDRPPLGVAVGLACGRGRGRRRAAGCAAPRAPGRSSR